MISFWGIDHGEVAKSFVRGEWISAGKLTKVGRSLVKGSHKAAHGMTPEHASFITHRRKIPWETIKAGAKEGVQPGPKDVGGTIHYGSKSAKRAYSAGFGTTPRRRAYTAAHEAGHAIPNSGYRTGFTLKRNPLKYAREEARADMVAGNYYRNTSLVSDRAIAAKLRRKPDAELDAYRGVQDKIAHARAR